MATVGGIVLCGGQSRRMGQPKAWLPFGDELLLQRIVRVMSGVLDPVIVVAALEQDLPPLSPTIRIVRDEERSRGPLQGLAAGLSACAGKVEAAFVSSCDMPFLQPSFIVRMISLLGNRQICVPYVDGHHHSLAAVYRVEVERTVRMLLAENRLRPYFLFDEVPTHVARPEELVESDPTFQSLRNLNTWEEYQAALRDAGMA